MSRSYVLASNSPHVTALGNIVGGWSAYPPILSVNADIPARQLGAMYGRRPQCKGKEPDFFAKRSGAATANDDNPH
jgi:hypothetical protein